MYSKVNSGAFAHFDDFFLKLLPDFGHDFLDTGGMDTAVCHQLVQCQTCDFPSDRVKCREDYGFGRVVYYYFHSRCGFQCPDIASFASDDASFYLIAVDMEYGDRVFDGRFSGHALYGLDDDAFGLTCRGELGIIHYVVYV